MRSMGIGMFGVAVILKLMVAITGIAIYKLGRALGLTSTIAFCAATAYTIFPVTQVFSSSFFFGTTLFTAHKYWGVDYFYSNQETT